MNPGAGVKRGLVVVAGRHSLVFPVAHVREVLRPLPVESRSGVSPFVRGLAIIRGVPTPVLDLARLLDEAVEPAEPTRFVVVDATHHLAAFSVERVLGVEDFGDVVWMEAPTLVGTAAKAHIESIAVRDARLLVVLRSARLLPESLWQELGVESS